MPLLRRRESFAVLLAAIALCGACTDAKPKVTVAELAGSWTVENPVGWHDLSGVLSIHLRTDGTATLVHGSGQTLKQWRLAAGQLIIFDFPGQVPFPPKQFDFAELDASRSRMRLNGDQPADTDHVFLVRRR